MQHSLAKRAAMFACVIGLARTAVTSQAPAQSPKDDPTLVKVEGGQGVVKLSV